MFEWILDSKTLLTIAHIFGVALGAGGAFASDAMFFLSIQDRKLSATELSFMKMGSRLVWAGLIILIASGIGLFSLDPERYMSSSKFLVKVTIVGLITLNGVVFHLWHLPRFHRHADRHFPSSDEFVRTSPYVMVSGVLSALSWSWAIVLGVLGSVPYSYGAIIGAYAATVVSAALVALLIRKRLLGLPG